MKRIIFFLLTLACISASAAERHDIAKQIDSLVEATAFNGVVLIKMADEVICVKAKGFSDPAEKTAVDVQTPFVIGSLSKQVTAVLVLREWEKGHLQLHVPIRKYLPELKQAWADTVTIDQLLSHTHGIVSLDGALAFKPGSRFQYSQVGYALLAEIIERTSHKTFQQLSACLFAECTMIHSCHPDVLPRGLKIAQGFNRSSVGLALDTVPVQESIGSNPVAAGGFISTADDLLAWNENLHKHSLLKDKTYRLMISEKKNALRDHPVFGPTHYGYGITCDNRDHLLQLGQTGLAPGFASMDFYFPQQKCSIIVLSNIVEAPDDLKKTFQLQVQILDLVRGCLKNQ